MARMTPREWDAICKRCGICCLIKINMCMVDEASGVVSGERTAYLKQCCDKLDRETCQCTMYRARLGRSSCKKVNMDIVLGGELLPASCGYVEYIFGPAPFPARVDFSQVRPVTEDGFSKMSMDEIDRDIIPESILWNLRQK